MEGDAEYARRRAQQEREAAIKARHPNAREAHLEMALRFDDIALAATVRDKQLGLNVLSA